MSKIIIPSNVKLSKNALKQLKKIEDNGNYDALVNAINEYLQFVSETPTDITEARNNGWRVEKLNAGKGNFVVSIRITQGDRFTYSVKDGEVTILGLLGHYVGTGYGQPEINFDKMKTLSRKYYSGLISLDDIGREINFSVSPLSNENGAIGGLEFTNNNGDSFILFKDNEDDITYSASKEKEIKQEILSSTGISSDEYDLLKNITSKRIDLFDERLTKNEKESDNEELVKAFSNVKCLNNKFDYKDAYGPGKITSRNPLILKLLESSDESTHNMGELMTVIENQFPELLDQYVELLKNNLTVENGNLLYNSDLDFYKLQSVTIVIRKLLSHEDTEFSGKMLLTTIINGDEDTDSEFYAYASLLKRYSKQERQSGLDDLVMCLCRCYENENSKEETLDNMRKLVILVETTGLTVQKSKETGYYHELFNIINYSEIYNSDDIMLHELGHAIDNYTASRDKTIRPDRLFERSKQHINNNPRSLEILEKIDKKLIAIRTSVIAMYNNEMIEKYGSVENAILEIEKKIIKKDEKGNLGKLLDKYGLPNSIQRGLIDAVENGDMSYNELAAYLYTVDQQNHISSYLYMKEEGSFLDIISAIFGDRDIIVQGKEVNLMFGHSKEYFEQDPDNSMSEIMANLNALIVSDKKELLDDLKDLIGEELWNYLMKERNNGRITRKGKDKGRGTKAA